MNDILIIIMKLILNQTNHKKMKEKLCLNFSSSYNSMISVLILINEMRKKQVFMASNTRSHIRFVFFLIDEPIEI